MKTQAPIPFLVRLPPAMHRKMVRTAALSDRSAAQVVREALRLYLEREGA